MKITDFKIFDKVCLKTTKFPMFVVGLHADANNDPNKGTIVLDFDGNEGDVFEVDVEDVEFC